MIQRYRFSCHRFSTEMIEKPSGGMPRLNTEALGHYTISYGYYCCNDNDTAQEIMIVMAKATMMTIVINH